VNQPTFVLFDSLFWLVLLPYLAKTDADSRGPAVLQWEFDFPHWGLFFFLVSHFARLLVLWETWYWSIAQKLSTDYSDYLWFFSCLAWFGHNVGCPTLICAAPIYAVFHRDGEKHTEATDALYWVAFVAALLDVACTRFPLPPAHFVWILLLIVADVCLTTAVYGSPLRFYSPSEVAASAVVIVAVYGALSFVTYFRDRFLLHEGPYER
jgi:hypothetical protein